jgi:hypothetical protein
MMNRRDAEKFRKGFIRLLVLGVFVLLTFGEAFAQGEPPQPINPKTIFAPSVEVVQTLPVFTYNNSTKVIWYFDPLKMEWTWYSYPADLDKIQDYKHQSNGTYLLSNEYYKGIAGAIWENVWVFDPKDGSIKKAESICNLVKALPGEGQWLFTQFSEDGQYRLCNNETGEQSKPLPEEMQTKIQKVCTYFLDFSRGLPSTSPDGQWVVFNTCEKTLPHFAIYSYNTKSQKINNLGAENQSYLELTKWADNQHILIRDGDVSTSGNHSIYIADVTMSQSLGEVSNQYAFEPTILDNPLRILWITSEFPDPSDNSKVVKLINKYDVSNQTSTVIARHPCDSITCEAGYVVWADKNITVFMNGYPLNTDYQAVIRDLKTDKELYSTRAVNGIVLSNDTFLFTVFSTTDGSCVLQKVVVHSSGIEKKQLPDSAIRCSGNAITFNNFMLSLSKGEALIIGDFHPQLLDIYNLNDQKRYTIVDGLADDYDLSAKWHDEHLVQVDVLKKEEQCSYQNCIIGSWIVQVNEEKFSK